jgi:pyruvate dehydrogenase E2 component (dihydrolipoamide acetyltransferase)
VGRRSRCGAEAGRAGQDGHEQAAERTAETGEYSAAPLVELAAATGKQSPRAGVEHRTPAGARFVERPGARDGLDQTRRYSCGRHLSVAWQAPHVTQHDRADVTELEAFRKAQAKRVEKAGAKLTVTAILIRIAAEAIRRFPQFASSVDMANEAIVYKKYCHIGVAVDTPNGLLVPVIRDADRKRITEIAVELADVSERARARKLSLDDMSGGVFTITNLGGIGGTSFTPVINQPEAAILGVSRGAIEPVWRDNQFMPREMLPLSLSYDHRVIDGADAARFLRFVAEALEQPMTVFL